jgi:hypothetical protein
LADDRTISSIGSSITAPLAMWIKQAVFEIGGIERYEGVRPGRPERPPQAESLPHLASGDGGYAGETPVFVVRRGEAEIAKALAGFFANAVDHAASPSIPT